MEGDLGEYKKMAADYGIVYNRNGVNKVYKFNDVDSGNLFSYINIIIANIYNSSKYVIQLNDFENKKMVIKASTGLPIPQDSIKIIKRRNFRKMSLYNEIEEEKVEERDYVVFTHNYTLNIGVRDNRFKIEFEYGEVLLMV